MSSEFAYTFPGGKLRQITIAATAGNVVTNLSPGAGKRWLMQYGTLTLTCSLDVANRGLVLQLTDGTNVVHNLGYSTTNSVATQTKKFDLGPTVATRGWTAGTGAGTHNEYMALQQPLVIEGSQQFRIAIVTGQAADSYEGYFYVLEIAI